MSLVVVSKKTMKLFKSAKQYKNLKIRKSYGDRNMWSETMIEKKTLL